MDSTKTAPAPHTHSHAHDHHDHSNCGHDHSHDHHHHHHTTEPIRVSKIGRNDVCPCGSGKKYKKCCLQHAHG